MEDKPDSAPRGLILIIFLGFFALLPLIMLVFTKGVAGTLWFLGGVVEITGVLGSAAASAAWLNRRLRRRSAVVLWAAVGVSSVMAKPLLCTPRVECQGSLLLLVGFFAAITGLYDALTRRSPPHA